jgi:hypothetical protein
VNPPLVPATAPHGNLAATPDIVQLTVELGYQFLAAAATSSFCVPPLLNSLMPCERPSVLLTSSLNPAPPDPVCTGKSYLHWITNPA